MRFPFWLRIGKHSAPAARRRTRSCSRQRTGYRPQFEVVENRMMLSGSGLPYPTAATGSQLSDDINYADTTGGALTINLNPGITFDLTNALPAVGGTKALDLTILGNGDTIEPVGSQGLRLLNVTVGASLTLEDVTLKGGYVGGYGGVGGAIFNAGALTISDSTLSGNSVNGIYSDQIKGGAIYNSGGTVTISNSTLSNNSATWGYGGAIYNAGGTVIVTNNTKIVGNYVSPAYSGGGGYGGGIYNDGGTLIVENSSSITGNYTLWWDQGAVPFDVYNLGVVYLDGTSVIGTPYGTPAILLDPNTPQLQIRDVSVTEGNTGTVAAEFTVTLSAASTETITVAYATADGSATAGSDYQAAGGTLTFAPGETSKTVTALVNGDRLGEPNETFLVNLSAATNATIVDGRAVGIIVDDEPRISIGDVIKHEGGRGQTTYFTYTVTLSAAYDQAVTVPFRTVAGTAKAGDDYVAKNGTLTFAPGETTKAITIEVKGDSKKEADETFYLDLFGNSNNSFLTKSRGIGTILNDD